MNHTVLLADLHLLVYRYGKSISSYLCPSEAAMRRKVEQLAEDFEDSVDDIMEHLNQFGSHEEGDACLLAPDLELCDPEGNPAPWPEKESAGHPNHYLVTGRPDGGEDITKYVVADVATDAEDKFKEWLGNGGEIFISMVVQMHGPPIAIYTDEGVEENPEPIQ